MALPTVGHTGGLVSGAGARACTAGPGGGVSQCRTALHPGDSPAGGDDPKARRQCAYRTTTAADNTTHYIVPRTEIQTGRRTILERLAINTARGNLAALVWELGILAVAVYQFGGYAVWRIRVGRNAQPVAKSWRDALPQGQCPQMQATPLVRSPMVAGALHPVLLVPAGEAPKGADCMLAHELTHIKRHDVAKKLLLTLVCILHWYNPAVWLLSAARP